MVGEETEVKEETLIERLEKLLESMKDWERKPVIQVGKAVVEIVKLPRRETSKRVEPERLALHLRLEDSFKGIFIIDYEEFKDLQDALRNEKVKEVIEAISEVNRKKKVIEFKL
ncbi:MAG TPA: hypothetical protein ENG05_02585 [Acidilobales archaeon]|nr:hypothetical protein [Acidilobales archaeon]